MGPFQIMKYLHAQIAVLGKDPSLNLKCVSSTPYTQSLQVISYSSFRDLYFSCDPSQGTGVEFSTHSVQRAHKVSDFRFSELRGLTSPIHTGSPSLFEHGERQSNNTPCPSFKDGTVSQGEGERKQNCPVVFNTRHLSVADLNYTTAG